MHQQLLGAMFARIPPTSMLPFLSLTWLREADRPATAVLLVCVCACVCVRAYRHVWFARAQVAEKASCMWLASALRGAFPQVMFCVLRSEPRVRPQRLTDAAHSGPVCLSVCLYRCARCTSPVHSFSLSHTRALSVCVYIGAHTSYVAHSSSSLIHSYVSVSLSIQVRTLHIASTFLQSLAACGGQLAKVPNRAGLTNSVALFVPSLVAVLLSPVAPVRMAAMRCLAAVAALPEVRIERERERERCLVFNRRNRER